MRKGFFFILFVVLVSYSYADEKTVRDYTKDFHKAHALAAVEYWKREFNLTDDQVKAIKPIVEENLVKIEEIAQGGMEMSSATQISRSEQLRQEFMQRLSKILNPDQLNRLQREKAAATISNNELNAQAGLRVISTASESYRAANNTYPANLAALSGANPPYIDATLGAGTKQGYIFTYVLVNSNQYTCTAVPVTANITGSRTFFLDERRVMRLNGANGAAI